MPGTMLRLMLYGGMLSGCDLRAGPKAAYSSAAWLTGQYSRGAYINSASCMTHLSCEAA